jgi:excisionase family DNA binding protein
MRIAMSDQKTPSQPAEKKTRKQTATHCGLSLRTIDELTRNGTLPFFKIGKAVRYDLNEVENALRQRFYVQAKARTASRIHTA